MLTFDKQAYLSPICIVGSVVGTECDVLIIGAGPAGIQAGIHAARKKTKTVIIGKPERSAISQAQVENYFGLPRVEGARLLEQGVAQVKDLGVEVYEQDVLKSVSAGERFVVTTDHDLVFMTKAVILAPGVRRVPLEIEGEGEFLGRGVSHCASCDCRFYRGKKAAVIGDESEAATSAILLAEYASTVYWVSGGLKVADELLEKVKAANVQTISPAQPSRIVGGEFVTGLELRDGRKLDLDGVFIELGAVGATNLALELGIVPEPDGIIRVNESMETAVKGIFACGDITGQPWQLARAVGQGCIAGMAAAKLVRQEGK
jgi:thioredoxin reductase (NADPH)